MARSREEYLKAKREGMSRLRRRDPDAARAKRNAFHAKNRDEQCARMRTYYAKRFFWGRAMKLRGPHRATTKQIASLWKSQRGLCAMTGRPLDRSAQLDHIIPKAKGGGNAIANLQWVCAEINYAKRALTQAQFEVLCESVMVWLGKRIELVESIGVAS